MKILSLNIYYFLPNPWGALPSRKEVNGQKLGQTNLWCLDVLPAKDGLLMLQSSWTGCWTTPCYGQNLQTGSPFQVCEQSLNTVRQLSLIPSCGCVTVPARPNFLLVVRFKSLDCSSLLFLKAINCRVVVSCKKQTDPVYCNCTKLHCSQSSAVKLVTVILLQREVSSA